MSESRTQLEEILELLLAEENEKAEEMLHEYVVAKARAEYEKVLDEDSSSEAEVEEAKKELALEVEELEDPPVSVAQEELMEKTDEPDDQEKTFEPDAEPIEEKSNELPVEDDPAPIEQQSAVNIEDIGELEEFEPTVDA